MLENPDFITPEATDKKDAPNDASGAPTLDSELPVSYDEDRLFILWTKTNINHDLYYRVTHAVSQRKDAGVGKCSVYLTTYGGMPDPAYRVARCLRDTYPKLRIVVHSFCKSAGTLIAVAGDELSIGDCGELGPLDIQLPDNKEIHARASALNLDEAMAAIREEAAEQFNETLVKLRATGLSTKLAAEFAVQYAAQLVNPLYAQIDPTRLGDHRRNNMIVYEYAKRLNAYSKNLNSGALDQLVNGYPCHSFVIDRKEARSLFKKVSPMTEDDKKAVGKFFQFSKQQDTVQLCHATPRPTNTSERAEQPADPAGSSEVASGVPKENVGNGNPEPVPDSGSN